LSVLPLAFVDNIQATLEAKKEVKELEVTRTVSKHENEKINFTKEHNRAFPLNVL